MLMQFNSLLFLLQEKIPNYCYNYYLSIKESLSNPIFIFIYKLLVPLDSFKMRKSEY